MPFYLDDNKTVYGNRTSYSKFVSRWDAPYNRDEQKSAGKDVRDKSQGLAEVAKKGYDPDEAGEAGARNYIDFYVEKAIAFGGHNVVNKNKILDMLLSGPRFMGRIPSERNGAVSGNSSSRYLDVECEVHLSRIASTDSKSVAKLQKETEITRKAIRGHHTYVSSKRYSLTR